MTTVSTSSTQHFPIRPIAAACALLFCAFGSPAALAQTDTADASVPVTVVNQAGIRRGIEGAITVKKDANAIVDAVSAEDIGKLPDNSIAESLTRLPGLAAQRVGGRAQAISVRGMSPDFATTLLNGREQVSTGDNRGVEFDQYPSELLSGVSVYKTTDAGLIGQGMSGTIDLQTVRPLNFPKRTVALNARVERNSLGKQAGTDALGNRFSVGYIDQYFNRTLGLAIGFAHLDTPVLSQETGLYEPWTTQGRSGLPANLGSTNGAHAGVRTGDNKRDGLAVTLQYRPSRVYNSTLDVYASRSVRHDTLNEIDVSLTGNGSLTPGVFYTDVQANGGTIGSAIAHDVYPLVRGIYNRRRDDIRTAGWNQLWRLQGVRLTADLSWSKAKRAETNLETNLQQGAGTDARYLDQMDFAVRQGAFPLIAPGRSYADSASLYIKDSIYGAGYGKLPMVEDKLKSIKLLAAFEAPAMLQGWLNGIDVGVNHTVREKNKAQPENSFTLVGPATQLPDSLVLGQVDLGFAGAGPIPAWNAPALISSYLNFSPSSTLAYLIPKQWQVREAIYTVFLKANIEHDLQFATVRGNIGVQAQHTNQSSAAMALDQSTAVAMPVQASKSYTDYLPSMNLAFSLANEQTVRLALAKQMARPRVDQLRAALEFNTDPVTQRPSGNGGNTQLDPWKAKAFDLSYEKYFGKRAYVAAAYFFKKLDSYIYSESRSYDLSAYAKGGTGTYTAPYNGYGGVLRGLELSASLPLDVLHDALSGFGVIVGANVNDSGIRIKDASSNLGSTIALPGMSKYTANVTVYYEKQGFEARVSQRHRSDFVGEISSVGAERLLRNVAGETLYDMQLGYNFTDGALKGIGLMLQLNNVTNTVYETYNDQRTRQGDFGRYGRTVLLGASYKF